MLRSSHYNGAMELESLEYRIVMEDGRDTEVLGRLANVDMATAAYMAAIAGTRSGTSPCATAPRSSGATTASQNP